MLVLRRARAARGLLLAACGAAAVATVLLTGLAAYGGQVVAAGARGAVTVATPEERSLLVRGPAGGAGQLAQRDAAVRAEFDGLPVTGAGYAVGRELTGDPGDATPDSGGVVFVATVFLDDLPRHAALVDGGWAQPGADPPQVTLGEAAARTLHAEVGDRLPIADRRTGRVTEVQVRGIWRQRDPADPYWLLSPEAADGVAPGSHTYGPVVLHREDFLRGYADSASLGWVVRPDLAGADLADLTGVRGDLARRAATLPERTGLGGSAQATTSMDALVDRLTRADLVGRSALLTPLLLIAVIGGYALLLVALLLTEHRRAETALMRARGAGRWQLAGLATREAALVVLPGALLAPLLAPWLLRAAAATPPLRDIDLVAAQPVSAPLPWAVAALAAAGCLLAMVGPAARRSGTYLEELGSRSRPGRWAAAQRASADLALVAFAVLAWLQLRQYSSPLAGSGGRLGIDPLLAAAPTLGVLAGAVLALRLLPPATRLGERFVDRHPWTATMLGMWQAGRRPHAGPVLLLALAVGAATLGWCLAATAERSVYDQADHGTGTDLRLVETSGFPPARRSADLAALPGAAAVVPAVRDALRLGPVAEPAEVVALDARAAAGLIRLRDDLAAPGVLDRLAETRTATRAIPLGAGATRLSGTVEVGLDRGSGGNTVESHAVLTDTAGLSYRIALGSLPAGGAPVDFRVALPDTGGRELSLSAFEVSTVARSAARYDWRLTGLAVDVDGAGVPVPLDDPGGWLLVDDAGPQPERPPVAAGAGLHGSYEVEVEEDLFYWAGGRIVRFSLVRPAPAGPVGALATPAALDALRIGSGGTTRLNVAGGQVDVEVVGVVEALPAAGTPAALLIDLPSLSTALALQGRTTTAQEWWVTTDPGQHAATAAGAARLTGLDVIDRVATGAAAGRDPYGVGARAALFAAALGAMLLALVGLAVDARSTARRRAGELAVLHTLGAGPRLLARSLVAEQTVLAGLGVTVGLLVGVGVAATMAPLVILTPAAGRPVPEPTLQIAWGQSAATAAVVLVAALAMSALVATAARMRVAATQLRIGGDQ